MTKIKVLKRARKTSIPRWKIRKAVKSIFETLKKTKQLKLILWT